MIWCCRCVGEARVRNLTGEGSLIASLAGRRDGGDAGSDPPLASGRCVMLRDSRVRSAAGDRGERGGVGMGVCVGGGGPDTCAADDADGALDGLPEDDPGGGLGFHGDAGCSAGGEGEQDEEREDGGAADGGADASASGARLLGVR